MPEEQKFPGYGLWCSGASLRLGCIPEPGAGCEPTGVVLVPVSLSGCPGSSAGPTGLAGHRAGAWVLALGHLSRSWAPAGPRASVLGIGRRMVFPGISGNRNFLEGGPVKPGIYSVQAGEAVVPADDSHKPPHPRAVTAGCFSAGCPTRSRKARAIPPLRRRGECFAAAFLSARTTNAACWSLVTCRIKAALF